MVVPRGTAKPCQIFNLVRVSVLAFFTEFLCCVFWLGIVFRLFGVLCGLKEEFCGEIKYGFLGFWIEKKTWKSARAL